MTLIRSTANNNPAPARCTITKIYEDNVHCDVETQIGELKYIDVIGSNAKVGNNAVILFFDEAYEDYVVIADTETLNPCEFEVIGEDLTFNFCGTSSGGGSSGGGVDIDTVKELINDRINQLSIDLNVDTMSNGYMRFDVELNKGE